MSPALFCLAEANTGHAPGARPPRLHVAETALDAPSGEVVLAGLLADAPDAPHLAVPPSRLGALLTFAKLAVRREL